MNEVYPSENAKTAQEFKDWHYQRLLKEDRLVVSAGGLKRIHSEGTDGECYYNCAFTIKPMGHYLLIKEDYTNEPARYGVILVTGIAEGDAEYVTDYEVGPFSGSEVIRYLMPTPLFTDAQRAFYESLMEAQNRNGGEAETEAEKMGGKDNDWPKR